jgi:DNA-binding Lrp family transcriptional regulator
MERQNSHKLTLLGHNDSYCGIMTDMLDNDLLSLLAENARTPVLTLAKKLGVARTTVQARIERLERTGVIAGYTIRRGALHDQNRIRATVLLQAEPRGAASLISRIRPIKEVIEVNTSSGRFDLILTVVAASTEALDDVLDTIWDFPGVRASESLIHLSTKIKRRP